MTRAKWKDKIKYCRMSILVPLGREIFSAAIFIYNIHSAQ